MASLIGRHGKKSGITPSVSKSAGRFMLTLIELWVIVWLIVNLAFIDSRSVKLKGRYPKISTKLELAILQKLFSNGKPLVEFYDVISGNPIYYRTSGGRYFNVITNYSTGSTQEKSIHVKK
ncbi:MAG: hypothetical protein NTW85_10815 [Methylococcales bacterium]|nr:hypothetical protein [Methylococcales bacterium]